MADYNMFYFISKLYWRFFRSPEQYARHIGVKIGHNSFIATRDFGTEPYLISIGSNCQITSNVHFHTHGGAHVARKQYPDFDVFGKIVIEDDVYVGADVHILPGVTIGKGALIAVGSIVTKSVPPGSVYGGNPAKRICSVQEYIERNISYNLNTKSLTPEEKKSIILSSNKLIIK